MPYGLIFSTKTKFPFQEYLLLYLILKSNILV
jgi:hypothetical protein